MLAMSRAFVNENTYVDALPDRPVSEHPNLVTAHGLALIEQALEAARRAYGEAQAAGDREGLAKAGRDLRYWSARRARRSCELPQPALTWCNSEATLRSRAKTDGDRRSGSSARTKLIRRRARSRTSRRSRERCSASGSATPFAPAAMMLKSRRSRSA
jgi:hypothetical protein